MLATYRLKLESESPSSTSLHLVLRLNLLSHAVSTSAQTELSKLLSCRLRVRDDTKFQIARSSAASMW